MSPMDPERRVWLESLRDDSAGRLNNLDEQYLEACPPPAAPTYGEVLFDDPEQIVFQPVDEPDPEGDEDEPDASEPNPTDKAFWDGANRYQDDLRRAVRDMSPYRLSREEFIILEAARWVTNTVRRNHNRPTHRTTFLDRVQNGNRNLVKAAPKVKSNKGSLISIIKPHLSDNIMKYEHGLSTSIDQGEIMRVSENKEPAYYKIRELLEQLSYKYGRPLELEEAGYFEQFGEFTEAEIADFETYHREFVPFDEVFGEASGDDIAADPADEPYESLAAEVRIDWIPLLFKSLDERERSILSARFGLDGDPRTLDSVAIEHEISIEWVRQIEATALSKLRNLPHLRDIIAYGAYLGLP